MDVAPPRPRARRRADALARLAAEVDAWVSTSGPDAPYLVPLSFLFDGTALWLSTSARSLTVRNLQRLPRLRIGLGPTRDLVLVEGRAELVELAAVDADLGAAFALKSGFDPRPLRGYVFIRVVPERVMAWREENELADRDLMRAGRWLD